MNNYNLYVKYWVEEDDEYFFYVDKIKSFKTIEDIKTWLASPIAVDTPDEFDENTESVSFITNKEEIEQCYSTPEEGYEPSFEFSRCTSPYSDELILEMKKKHIADSVGDGVYFCPYCGKYRTFYDNDEGDVNCEVCEVSIKNYDVKRHNDL